MSHWRVGIPLLVSLGLTPIAQERVEGQQGPIPMVAASGRVETSVSFDGRLMANGGAWLNRSTSHSGPARLAVDYGQPHARGRTIFGDLVPYGEVWRLGANMATHLTADLDVRIGDLVLVRGAYSLYLLPAEDGTLLIVNRQTRQWGTEYDPAQDVGRVSMLSRDLPEPIQSLSITLEPTFPQAESELPTGVLRVAWGLKEHLVPWSVVFPR